MLQKREVWLCKLHYCISQSTSWNIFVSFISRELRQISFQATRSACAHAQSCQARFSCPQNPVYQRPLTHLERLNMSWVKMRIIQLVLTLCEAADHKKTRHLGLTTTSVRGVTCIPATETEPVAAFSAYDWPSSYTM